MKYELMVILKPMLPEDIKAKVLKSIEDNVANAEGKIEATDVWGKRHLAYPINNHDEGYYIVYKVELSPDKITEFKKQLKLTNGVLRTLLVKESEL
jgi:small subunit ribosomal protein S6